MLYSAPGCASMRAATWSTSSGRICRRSGRGCTVIPWAPASRQIRAARTRSGIPLVRVLRRVATLLTLTESRVMSGAATPFPARRGSEHDLRGGHDVDPLGSEHVALVLQDSEDDGAGVERHDERPALHRGLDQHLQPGAHRGGGVAASVQSRAQGERAGTDFLADLVHDARAVSVRIHEGEVAPLQL